MTVADTTSELRRIVAPAQVIDDPAELEPYRSDWYTTHPGNPTCAILPTTTAQVAAAVQFAATVGVPIVPRGAGTGLAGGARPLRGGIVLGTSQMNRVERVQPRNRIAWVQPGIINYELSQQLLADYGYYFAPDPASWKMCTLGGNIANNSGGPHCLKYGVTTNHILGVELVLPDGRVLQTSDGTANSAGYDLTGLVVGSEGTLGMVTQAIIRITRASEAIRLAMALFPDMVAASESVSRIVAAGYVPTSLEVMDAITIRAVNDAYDYGLPDHAGAALIIEVDGVSDGIDDTMESLLTICREQGALDIRTATTAAEQEHLWAARKSAFEALRKVYPDYYLVDTVVPRTLLPSVIEQVVAIGERYGLPIANVFHAGDGNLHPLVLHDPNNPDEVARTHQIIDEVMHLSIANGGAITGEHGIGADKQDFMSHLYARHELAAMATIYRIFNPNEQFNPGKVFPSSMPPLALAAERTQRIAATQGTTPLDHTAPANGLHAIVGTTHVLSGNATRPFSVQGRQPTLVVAPATVDELAAVMQHCHATGATVVPWGGGTRQERGILTATPDVVVHTRRMAGVFNYNRDDLTISVAAGTTLSELRTVLAANGQMIALDVAQPDQTTLGGIVATAATGARRLRYGTLRDMVLGLTVVEVDGTISRFGGQVVKNVSGYDMPKLFIGSHGTLGIIASVNLRTMPLPQHEGTLLIGFADQASAMATLDALAETQLTPAAVEFLGRGAFQQMGMAGACGLAIWLDGTLAACQRHVRDITMLAHAHSPTSERVLHHDAHTELWHRIASLLDSHNWSSDEALLRVAVPPADLAAAVQDLEQQCATRQMTCVVRAHALNGVLYARVSGTPDRLHSLQQHLVTRWRHSHVLACDPARKDGLAVWGAPHDGYDIMQQIKQAFDPAGRLNPGRLV